MKLCVRRFSAFTLPEILVVVAILAILALIVIIAIDPVHRFEEARDSRRLSDTQTITSALHQYVIDHRGALPAGLDKQERQIGTASAGCALQTDTCHVEHDTDCIDLTAVVDPYLHGMPLDPDGGSQEHTRYSVRLGDNNAIVVKACNLSRATLQ